MKIYTDTLADVHLGDTVRYVWWDYATRGKFYRKTGTVTELRGGQGDPRDGWIPEGALGVHFPHHARGTNLVDTAARFRLVQHAGRIYSVILIEISPEEGS